MCFYICACYDFRFAAWASIRHTRMGIHINVFIMGLLVQLKDFKIAAHTIKRLDKYEKETVTFCLPSEFVYNLYVFATRSLTAD